MLRVSPRAATRPSPDGDRLNCFQISMWAQPPRQRSPPPTGRSTADRAPLRKILAHLRPDQSDVRTVLCLQKGGIPSAGLALAGIRLCLLGLVRGFAHPSLRDMETAG
jgi:hypothetical protein